jgi:hypothetical protein
VRVREFGGDEEVEVGVVCDGLVANLYHFGPSDLERLLGSPFFLPLV